ncbi:MAG: ABC transporter ATP-binding protein/permease [Rickettsiales bacterium]|nr:ABC transporter ATP-binding protein/permease [Rickettsiales bacterium]
MTAHTPEPQYDSSYYLVSRLLSNYIKPYTFKIVVAVFCMIIVAITTAANAWTMQPVLDDIFLKKDGDMLMLIPAVVLTIAIVKGIAVYGQSFIMKFVGQRIITDVQQQLFKHLLHSDLSSFHDNRSGNLLSRFSNDITIMRRSVSNVLTGIAKETLTLIFLIGLMFYQNWIMALLAFTVFPVAIYPVLRLGKRMRKISNDTQHKLGDFTVRLDETFKGIKVVKSYNREPYELKRSNSMMEDLFSLYVKAARTESLASPIMETLGGIAIAAVIWYGGYQVIYGDTTPGAFFSFITALIMAYKPMKSLSGLNTALQEGLAAAKRLFVMLDVTPEIQNPQNPQSIELASHEIRFTDVDFGYQPSENIISNLSLHVPAGKTVALVGASGGCKTTLMRLLLRFYDVNSGSISIGNHDIRTLSLDTLRDLTALVSQDVLLFDDTIRANIAYGNLDANDEEIKNAAIQSAADDFIQDFPDGYDTIVGQNGAKLSGGQRQRIAIARAILKNAPILLLDEATSALDTISEQKIQHALESLMQDKTTLVIAHRLSTIQNADIIYVIENGSVIESGSHDSLMNDKAAYYRLHYHPQHDNDAGS